MSELFTRREFLKIMVGVAALAVFPGALGLRIGGLLGEAEMNRERQRIDLEIKDVIDTVRKCRRGIGMMSDPVDLTKALELLERNPQLFNQQNVVENETQYLGISSEDKWIADWCHRIAYLILGSRTGIILKSIYQSPSYEPPFSAQWNDGQFQMPSGATMRLRNEPSMVLRCYVD